MLNRYLASLAYPIDKRGIESSLIEWEESYLAPNTANDDANSLNKLLSAAESVVSKAKFTRVSCEPYIHIS